MVGVAGSNPRPLVPRTSALTGLRYTPTALLIGPSPRRAMWRRLADASAARRAGLHKDSFCLANFGQRFAQRLKLVVREPGIGLCAPGSFAVEA